MTKIKKKQTKIKVLSASWILKFLTFQSICYQSDPLYCKISLKSNAWFLQIDHHIRKSILAEGFNSNVPVCSKKQSQQQNLKALAGKAAFPSGHCLQTHECHPPAKSHTSVLFSQFHVLSHCRFDPLCFKNGLGHFVGAMHRPQVCLQVKKKKQELLVLTHKCGI